MDRPDAEALRALEERLTRLLPSIADSAVGPFDAAAIAREAAGAGRRSALAWRPSLLWIPVYVWLAVGLLAAAAVGAALSLSIRQAAGIGPILYVGAAQPDGPFQDIYFMDNDHPSRRIATIPGLGNIHLLGPVWSPDHTKFALAATIGQDQTPTLVIMDVAGDTLGTSRADGSGVATFAWSPDSRRLAVAPWLAQPDRRRLLLVDARGVQVGEIPAPVPTGFEAWGPYSVMAWSPDGTTIAASICDTSCPKGNTRIILVSTDGSGTRVVPGSPYGWAPTWSSTGSLAWTSAVPIPNDLQAQDPTCGGNNCVWGIGVLTPDGRREDISIPGVSLDHPAWSPDGSRLAFESGTNRQVYVARPGAGAQIVQWPGGPELGLSGLRWSADGASILLGGYPLDRPQDCILWAVPPQGGRLTVVQDGACGFDGG